MFKWNSRKKEPPKEGRIIHVPDEYAFKILELTDKFMAAPAGQDRTARYVLWKNIQHVVPETKVGKWKLLELTGTTVRVQEILP